MSSAAAAQWGQTDVPTKVFAVYQPYTASASVTKAQLFYTTDTGTVTNTASFGPGASGDQWMVDTTWYDAQGNVIQTLDGSSWARAQSAAVADRLRIAAEASSYIMYNTWGDANTAGTLVTDEYGPAHTATLKDGTTGLFRTHTATMYDNDPNVDPALIATRLGTAGLGLVVKQTASASDAARTNDYDPAVIKYGYAPVASGDANGWQIGVPTSTSRQTNANDWSTAIARYDSSGRLIESRQPGGASDSNGAGSDAHATVTTYYSADGLGQCGGKPEWAGLVCTRGPATQPAGTTTIFNADYNADLMPTSVQEMSGGTAIRTTTTSYDALDRITQRSVHTGGNGLTNETLSTTYDYDPSTGLQTATTSSGSTVSTHYDAWGRIDGYSDANDNNSSQTYDAAGNIVSFNDGSGNYTYTYDDHNVLASVNAGAGVGTFTYGYGVDGTLRTVTYPNGLVSTQEVDQIGKPTALSYTQGSSTVAAFSAAYDVWGEMRDAASPESSQEFGYDGLGRLTDVEDSRTGACITRTYGFDASSNRSSLTTYGAGANGECQSSTAISTKSSTYDSAGRLMNSGYTYDSLGRTLTVPQTDANAMGGAGSLTVTYHANDMVASLSQPVANATGGVDTVGMTYALDPSDRINAITTKSNGTESNRIRYEFSAATDSPSAVDTSSDGGSTWTNTRYVSLPGVGMAGSQSGGTTTLQLRNLHGDIVATQEDTLGTASLASYSEADEYGVAIDASAQRFGWLGADQRAADTLGGLNLMGARIYNPVTGSFASPDPVLGGNTTSYTYPQDPVNDTDLTGESDFGGFHAIWHACMQYAGLFTCADVLRMSAMIATRVQIEIDGPQRRNAIRHFVWMVYLMSILGRDGAVAVGNAHEAGTKHPHDSARDQANNRAGRRWYLMNWDQANRQVNAAGGWGYHALGWFIDTGSWLFQVGFLYKLDCDLRVVHSDTRTSC